LTQGSTATSKKASNESEDRFLKLLVTQMKNQDPLNPMQNAELTSQLAQISTVNGIEKLNSNFTGLSTDLNASMVQMQMLQGVSMVGRQVLTEGNTLNIQNGQATGGFSLDSAATSVDIDIKNNAGQVVDRLSLGYGKKGHNNFQWIPPANTTSEKYTFSVSAKEGNNALVTTLLSSDFVEAVNNKDGTLNLQLRNGTEVPYSKVKSFY
jgi:flagellar basal-body rod modification protein FlgD